MCIGRLLRAAAVVDQKHILAGHAHRVTQAAGTGRLGARQHAVRPVIAQPVEIFASQQSQPQLVRTGPDLKIGGHQRGLLAQSKLQVAPGPGGDVKIFVDEIHVGGGGQQQECNGNHADSAGRPQPSLAPQRAKMGSMNDSMAQPRAQLAPLELPGWKTAINWTAAVVLAIVFLVSGLYKITDPQGWAVRLTQLRFPESLSLAGALGVGITETLAGVLVLVPRFRRWGAILTGLLLVAFMIYMGMNYAALKGADCSCFPIVKRVVGPMFFVGDAALLLVAVGAGVWSKPASGIRSALVILGAVAVFAGVSYGVAAARETGTKAPDTITVNGKPYSLQHGKILLFFFDPECMHCLAAGKRMATFNWGDTAIVAIPIQQPQFAAAYLEDTKLKALVSNDLQQLKAVFPFVSVPAGVALENGREKMPLTKFEGDEPAATLKQLGFIQ